MCYTLSLWSQGEKNFFKNQQCWKTSTQPNKRMIPHFPEPALCHIMQRLVFFSQMKTAGCLTCYSGAPPSSSVTTCIWRWESDCSGTGKLQTRLFGDSLEYEALKPEERYNNGSNFTAPSQYFICSSQAGLLSFSGGGAVSLHANCSNSLLLRVPQKGLG